MFIFQKSIPFNIFFRKSKRVDIFELFAVEQHLHFVKHKKINHKSEQKSSENYFFLKLPDRCNRWYHWLTEVEKKKILLFLLDKKIFTWYNVFRR